MIKIQIVPKNFNLFSKKSSLWFFVMPNNYIRCWYRFQVCYLKFCKIVFIIWCDRCSTIWKCSLTVEHLWHQYQTSALSNEVYNFVLAKRAEKLLAVEVWMCRFPYYNRLYIFTMADNFWAPWPKTKLYTSLRTVNRVC